MNGEGKVWRSRVGKFKSWWWTQKCGALLGDEHSSQPSCLQKAGRTNEDQCQTSRHRFEFYEGKVGFLFEAAWRSSHARQQRDARAVSAHPCAHKAKGQGSGGAFASELWYSLAVFPNCLILLGCFCFGLLFTWDYCSPSGLSQWISLAREEILSDVSKINQKSNQPLENTSGCGVTLKKVVQLRESGTGRQIQKHNIKLQEAAFLRAFSSVKWPYLK